MFDPFDVFISHVEEDAAEADQFAHGLEAAGFTTWSYERDSVVGVNHLIQTLEAVKVSRAVALLISTSSFASPFVDIEIMNALQEKKPFMPVLLRISHAEFVQRAPTWAMAVGAAATITVPREGLAAILPKIVTGLKLLGIEPGAAPPPSSPPTSAPEHLQALRTLRGHTDKVEDCAVSPDGRFIVSASRDNTLKVWDAAGGQERLTLLGHTGWVFGCAVAPDGSWIVSCSQDGTLGIWGSAEGERRFTLAGHMGKVYGCAIDPAGRFVASANEDGTVRTWSADSGTQPATLKGHTAAVRRCAFSPDGRRIVSAGWDASLRIWTDGSELATLVGHGGSVTDCSVAPAGDFLVSASRDGTLKVWDATSMVERATLRGHEGPVYGCAVSPDGGFIVSAGGDGTVRIWDAASGSLRATLLGHTDKVYGCAISPDGAFIVSASADRTLKMWRTDDLARGDRERVLLFISQGGTCRDPMAKAIVLKLLETTDPGFPIRVEAMAAGPPSKTQVSGAARRAAIDLLGEDLLAYHTPQQITDGAIREADLILVMDGRLKKSFPPERTFVLKPFLGLDGDVDDPWPDGTDAETLARYARCCAELKESIEGNFNRIVEALRRT